LKLRNQKNYVYKELFAIRSSDSKSFSKGGDSGSIIYSADGMLLGSLVGADPVVSLGCIGERCITRVFDPRHGLQKAEDSDSASGVLLD